MKTSNVKMGWIGLRAERLGKAGPWLKRNGWMKLQAADIRNRNGFDFVLPTRTFEQFQQWGFRDLSLTGFRGVAVWFTDLQWGQEMAVTDAQWGNRKHIHL